MINPQIMARASYRYTLLDLPEHREDYNASLSCTDIDPRPLQMTMGRRNRQDRPKASNNDRQWPSHSHYTDTDPPYHRDIDERSSDSNRSSLSHPHSTDNDFSHFDRRDQYFTDSYCARERSPTSSIDSRRPPSPSHLSRHDRRPVHTAHLSTNTSDVSSLASSADELRIRTDNLERQLADVLKILESLRPVEDVMDWQWEDTVLVDS